MEEFENKSGWTGLKVIAVGLVCSLLGGLFGGVVAGRQFIADVGQSVGVPVLEGNRENPAVQIHQVDTGEKMTPTEVYATMVNATVGITTSITTNYWGYKTTSAASGSGFIFSSDGYIITNFHVVENSDSITVSLFDGRSYDAELIGYDAGNDVAILKVDATDLTPVVLGDSDQLNIGDDVVAIGNPLGELTFSLTSGVVSAKDREITMASGATMRLIQTDCAINSGNSGGALLNLYGEVVGITNAKYSSDSSREASIDNIGFAIPINKAREIAESIIEKGYVSKPYIGISAITVSKDMQGYGLPEGASVQSITEGSPADSAGLRKNDIITHVGKEPIATSSQLVGFIQEAKVGDELKFTIYRQGGTMELSVTVGEQIQAAKQ
jgi:serine protease Do